MFSIGGWLAAVMPMVGGQGSKSLPNHCPQPMPDCIPDGFSASVYPSEFAANNALATINTTPAQSLPAQVGCVAVRLASCDGQRLRIIADVSRPAPRNVEDAAVQFIGLMRDAVGRGYLPASVAFTELRRFYDGIASEFEWPAISDVRLPKLLERNGCVKTVSRDRKNGRDKRTVAYRLK